MIDQTNANIERHIKTHTVRSDDDRAAVSVLETFLRSNGRINTSLHQMISGPITMALSSLFPTLTFLGGPSRLSMSK